MSLLSTVVMSNLHVLIDEERHARLTEESKRTGRSVGDIVRSAIDLHFDEERDQARRAAAARFLLATADTGEGPAESWEEMLDARARDIEEMLET
jgi:predicted DNA-binding protein